MGRGDRWMGWGLAAAVAAGGAFAVSRLHRAEAAGKPRALVCDSTTAGWKASIVVYEDGGARFEVSRGGKRHGCALAIQDFSNDNDARVANMAFQFTRGACDPALAAADEKNLMTNIPLILRKRGNPRKPPVGTLQWLWEGRTSPCNLRVYRGAELARYAERWKLGTWGR